MALSDTKQKILDCSLELFNQNGIANVRLQQIADEAGISVGNLAYHFNNKEAIAESLITQVFASLQDILRNYGRHASLDDMDLFIKDFYQVCDQYNFFNYDILEIRRSYPDLFVSFQQIFVKIRLQIERRLELYQKGRLLQPGADIKSVAANLWLFLFYLPAEGLLMSKRSISALAYRRRTWGFLCLYFTEKGMQEYADLIEPDFAAR